MRALGILLLIVLSLGMHTVCFGDGDVRFAVVSDIHIGVEGAVESLEKVVNDINRSEAEFVVVLGDVTESGRDAEFRTASGLLSRLEKPYYTLTGNHDTKFPESGMTVFRECFGRERFGFVRGGYYFLGIPSGPYLHDTAASFLREDIAPPGGGDGMPVILFTHHPLDEVSNAGECARVGGNNVAVAFGGHLHSNQVKEYGGIGNLICASSLTGEDGRNLYNMVTLCGDRLTVAVKDAGGGTERIWFETTLGNRLTTECGDRGVNDEKTVWRYKPEYSVPGGAVFGRKAVYLGNTGGEVLSLDISTGLLNWKYGSGGEIYGVPAEAGERLYCGSADGTVFCLDASTGTPVWVYDTGAPVTASVACNDGRLYYGNTAGRVAALDASSGAVIWERRHGEPIAYTSPAITDGLLCFGGIGGSLYLFGVDDGRFAGEVRVSKVLPRNAMAGQVLYGNRGKIVTATREKEIAVWDPRTSRVERYRWEKDYSPSLGYDPQAGIFVARGQRNGAIAFRLGLDGPEILWETEIRTKWENSFQPPVIDGGYVLLPSFNTLYILDRGTGRKTGTVTIGEILILSAAITRGGTAVVTVSADGTVACTEL